MARVILAVLTDVYIIKRVRGQPRICFREMTTIFKPECEHVLHIIPFTSKYSLVFILFVDAFNNIT